MNSDVKKHIISIFNTMFFGIMALGLIFGIFATILLNLIVAFAKE